MLVIQEVAEKLIKRILSQCPKCSQPGYGREDVKRELPCAHCTFPSSGVQADIYKCLNCGREELKNESSYPKSQDPMYCLICNP